MEKFRRRIVLVAASFALTLAVPGVCLGAPLSPELEKKLEQSKYVYISSTRQDGSLGKPAEIWFLYYKGAVYVGTPPGTWRVRRIKAGRPQAKIWVGKRDGPSFEATGEIIDDPQVRKVMLETYGEKYPERWNQYEEKFRSGFKDGSRVMVKYTPTGSD